MPIQRYRLGVALAREREDVGVKITQRAVGTGDASQCSGFRQSLLQGARPSPAHEKRIGPARHVHVVAPPLGLLDVCDVLDVDDRGAVDAGEVGVEQAIGPRGERRRR